MNGLVGLLSRKHTFVVDQRGAVALETTIVYLFLCMSILLPLADMAVAGFKYISAKEALRAFGQSIQYSPPPDVTNPSSWVTSAVAKSDPNFPVTTINVLCGSSNAACSSTNNGPPMSYSYSTTVTLAPIVLRSVLCTSSNTNPCTFTLPFSERFN